MLTNAALELELFALNEVVPGSLASGTALYASQAGSKEEG